MDHKKVNKNTKKNIQCSTCNSRHVASMVWCNFCEKCHHGGEENCFNKHPHLRPRPPRHYWPNRSGNDHHTRGKPAAQSSGAATIQREPPVVLPAAVVVQSPKVQPAPVVELPDLQPTPVIELPDIQPAPAEDSSPMPVENSSPAPAEDISAAPVQPPAAPDVQSAAILAPSPVKQRPIFESATVEHSDLRAHIVRLPIPQQVTRDSVVANSCSSVHVFNDLKWFREIQHLEEPREIPSTGATSLLACHQGIVQFRANRDNGPARQVVIGQVYYDPQAPCNQLSIEALQDGKEEWPIFMHGVNKAFYTKDGEQVFLFVWVEGMCMLEIVNPPVEVAPEVSAAVVPKKFRSVHRQQRRVLEPSPSWSGPQPTSQDMRALQHYLGGSRLRETQRTR